MGFDVIAEAKRSAEGLAVEKTGLSPPSELPNSVRKCQDEPTKFSCVRVSLLFLKKGFHNSGSLEPQIVEFLIK